MTGFFVALFEVKIYSLCMKMTLYALMCMSKVETAKQNTLDSLFP